MPSASPASRRPAIKPAAHNQPLSSGKHLPRVVAAELKKKSELTRSSSTEGGLHNKTRKVAPVRNGKAPLKRSLSSEGVLDCRNLSISPPQVPPLPRISSDNLSTVIAVDYDSSPHSSIGTQETVEVITQSEDVPLSSTIIAVNYSSGESNGSQPPLPPRTRYFNGKSSVWSKLESRQSSNIAVNINIKQGVAEETNPPPVPPLPSSLVTKHFTNVNPSVSPPAVPPRNGDCTRPSRIPRKLVPPTGLPGVDCESRRRAWDELIKKYEALEEECSVHSSEDEKKSTEDVFKAVVAKVVTDDKDKFVNLNTILGKSKVSESIAKFEAHKEDVPVKPSLFRGLKCADTIHLYHAGGYWASNDRQRQCRTPTEQTKEPAERRARRNSDGDEPSGGGIGVVRASTGRQVSDSRYRTELEIFFRSGVLAQLEAQRDERLTDHVVRLQAQCRGYLARRRLAKLKIQDLAVRCIQRNVRKFMSVRDWPWWRLLVRVTPLLNVHRTEEELRLKTEELEMLRAKVEKLEEERGYLKHDTDRLEAKITATMLPGSSRFGPGIVDDRQSSPSILNKRLIQPVKRAFTTSELPDRVNGLVTNKPPLPTRSVFSPTRTSASPARDIMSPSRVFSPTRTSASPARDVMSPSRVFSPTREPSVLRDIFSPTRTSPGRDVFSPTRDYLSPSRSRSMSVTSSVFGTSRDCSPAPSFSTYSPSYSASRNVLSSGSGGPRRMFPQVSAGVDLRALEGKDKAPVVFGAGLSFIIGGGKAKVRQKVRPVAAHLEPTTASSALSTKISEFLKKSDHVMDEWRRIGRKDPERDLPPGIQSKSATNILIKGYQLYSQDRSSSCRSPRPHKAPQQDDDDTLDEADELSEMTADLAEEHSTATLATERLEAETSERLRLEKELQDVQHENKSLHQQGERLEMELLYMRAADMNGVGSEDEEDGEGDAGVYKQRYERAARELEFTKRRMQQQHEDDLEQLVGLKKQLEKKLADAYEEVEEQRQVVGQWKRKVQKLNAETNDLRLLLEEQSSRNNLLEKKQRKFDAELQLLQDELRQEKQQKERLSREKEMAVAEKYTMEQNLGAVRLELELKEERVAALTQELDELMFGGKTEEEVAHLKKTKHELEKKVKEQEEELDDLAGQVQLLEQAKLRLEMSLEQQRKENRRETAQRDEELEDVRCNAHKKVKALEAQLESEHEERTLLLREKHELERRLSSMEEQERAARATDEDQLHRLKRDLKRTKALLRDAQTMLERARCESPGKALIRQLRNQLEDAEFARSAAVKARQGAELELQEVQGQLEEAQRARSEAEERAVAASKERSELRTQLEENEEELAEVLKKYRAAVQQLSVDQLALQEQAGRVAELESERASLREQLAELGSRLESMETLGDPSSSLMQKRLELRTKELESKLELEQTTRSRLEVQITRLKEAVEKLQDEAASARAKEQLAQDNARKLQRTLRELREEHTGATAREAEAQQRRRDLEKRLETAEAEASAARGDLRLALTRIEDLQSAMQGELEDDLSNSDGDNSESDHESEGSDESISAFLANHKVRVNSSPRAARPSFELDITSRSVEVTKKPTETSGKESFA